LKGGYTDEKKQIGRPCTKVGWWQAPIT